jgi:5-methylcytosine-specific restriction endonuclease McrA
LNNSQSKSQVETVESYHHYLATMECLKSSDAKRRWRKAIKETWGNCCCFCGNPPISDKSLTIDHLKPRAKGGETTLKNCLPACEQHNRSKGSSDWKPWYRNQSFYAIEREARILFWLDHSRLPTEQELQEYINQVRTSLELE